MKVLWSALSLVVVGVLAVLLWNSASAPPDSEVLRNGVVIEGSRDTATPSPKGTVNTPSEENPDDEDRKPGAGDDSQGEEDTAEADSQGSSGGVTQAEGRVGQGAPAAPEQAAPAAPEPVVPAAPAPQPAQVPVPVQPAPNPYVGGWGSDDEWDDDGDDGWDDDEWDDD